MSVFLGWVPNAAAQAALATLQDGIRAALPADAPRHDWRKPAQLHMTLRYLGEGIDEAQRVHLDAAMAAFSKVHAAPSGTLVGAQYWPHARVLVAKIDASDALKGLLKDLEAEARACGFAAERAQTAHITLAYLPRGAMPPPLPLQEPEPYALTADRIQLLQTTQGGYISTGSWPLAAPH